MAPKISIIVATLNSATNLQRCIDSVSGQSYADKELIIKDGNSTDDTQEVIKQNKRSISRWISESDRGVYDAWNTALDHCNGEWICFLGDDDFFWKSDSLENLANTIKYADPDINVIYGKCAVIDRDDQVIEIIGHPWEQVKNRFKQIMCIPHPGTLHHQSLFSRHGKFDTRFTIAGDYEFLLRELKSSDAAFTPKVVCGFSANGMSSKPSHMLKSLFEVRSAQRLHIQSKPGLIWSLAIGRAFIRLLLWRSIGEKWTRKILDQGRRFMGKPPFWTKT